MSDIKKLEECLKEYRKANKGLDDKLKQIEADNRQARQEAKDKLNR